MFGTLRPQGTKAMLSITKHYFSSPKYSHQLQPKSLLPFHNIKYAASKFNFYIYTSPAKAFSLSSFGAYYYKKREKWSRHTVVVNASRGESPYQVLGVSPSATPDQIKRAYRKLALKYHPDVNKEANAQEKFMRIKHAYNTLMNSKSKKRYDGGGRASDYSYNTAGKSQSRTAGEEEDFYGFGDFLRDLQEEFRNWEASVASQGKPKSLWEELAEIGEEFVEFLEKELNITDLEVEGDSKGTAQTESYGTKGTGSNVETEKDKGSRVEDSIDEIEAALAQLKKELGL